MFGYAKRKRVFWRLVLVLSVICIALLAYIILVTDPTIQSNYVKWLKGPIEKTSFYSTLQEVGTIVSNSVISGLLVALLTSLITVSIIYIYKIPEMRRIAIQIIASGYYENFLHSVIQKVHSQIGSVNNSVIIVLPGFALVENKAIYWNSFQSYATKHGFTFVQETTDKDFGRNIFTIQRSDDSIIPIFIDMPTTLTNLKKIIELETHSPVGTTSDRTQIKERFYFLRDQFEEELRTYVTEHDWGNVRFIEGRSLRKFEKELDIIMDEMASLEIDE